MSRGVFITGTDTGVGKTAVAALLVRGLALQGLTVGVMKPFETGCPVRDGLPEPADAAFLREVSGGADPVELVAPYRFTLPLAPLVAADREGRSVDLAALRAAYSSLSARYDVMVVEGIGGLCVPLARRNTGTETSESCRTYFVTDLIRDLDLPSVVVTRPVLGTLNHTLLTVSHALREGLRVLGVVINYTSAPAGTIAEETNQQVLESLCPTQVLGTVPYLGGVSPGSVEAAALSLGRTLAHRVLELL